MGQRQATKAFLYLLIGFAMLIYAIPRLPDVTFSEEGLFTVVWLLFALLSIGANLYTLIGADRDHRGKRAKKRVRDREMERAIMRFRDYDHHNDRMFSR